MSTSNLIFDYVRPAFDIQEQIMNLISSIEDNELKEYTQMYLNHNLNMENIDKSMEKMDDNTNKDIRKGYYKQQHLRYMNYFFFFLIFLYIGLFIYACVTLYRKNEMKPVKKFGIVFALFFLPLFSTKLLLIVLYIMQTLYKYMPKNVRLEKIKLIDLKH